MFNLPTNAEVHKAWLVGQIEVFAEAFGITGNP